MEHKIHLVKLAKIVRGHLENILIDNYNYNNNLNGACGIASYYLMMVAKKQDIYVTLCYGYFDNYFSHWWITYCENTYDLTATQFDVKDKVYITDGKRYTIKEMWRKPKEAFKAINKWCHYPDELIT